MHNFIKKHPVVFVLTCLAVFFLIFIGMSNFSGSPEKRAAYILEDSRLSKLPKSAVDVKTDAWFGIFAGEAYLMFKASAEQIQEFINTSPSIKDLKPEVFNSEKQYLQAKTQLERDSKNQRGRHKYYWAGFQSPSWYDPTITIKGRRYKVPNAQHPEWAGGDVVVNDDTGYVYIHISFD